VEGIISNVSGLAKVASSNSTIQKGFMFPLFHKEKKNSKPSPSRWDPAEWDPAEWVTLICSDGLHSCTYKYM
jgi:hypothetical protein